MSQERLSSKFIEVLKFLETFWHNPQYRITLVEPDDNDDDGKCTLIVALMQKNRRAQRNMGMDVLTIGFAIYHVSEVLFIYNAIFLFIIVHSKQVLEQEVNFKLFVF